MSTRLKPTPMPRRTAGTCSERTRSSPNWINCVECPELGRAIAD
jgi:hypothetical protein